MLLAVGHVVLDFPSGSDCKESACSAGDLGPIPGSGRFPWRREWPATPLFLPGEFHGHRSLVGYNPRGRKELDATEQLTYTHTHRHTHTRCYIFRSQQRLCGILPWFFRKPLVSVPAAFLKWL